MDAARGPALNAVMSDASDEASAFDPAAVIPRDHALTPAVVKVNERRVARGFWPKIRKAARHVPFAREAVAVYFCARDTRTPATAKALMMAALAYFVLPTDAIPDFIAGLGYTDDAAVIATVLTLIGRHLRPEHKEAAQAFLDRLARDD